MKRQVFLPLAATLLLATACGAGDGSETATAAGSGSGSSGGGGGITIMSPEDGATVQGPVTLEFEAGDIGPEETGKDHVHLFTDGQETEYEVVTEESFVIKGLSEGEHTIDIQKQHADHSPTGDEAQLTVTVASGGGGGDSSDGGTDDGRGGGSGGGTGGYDPGGGYDY